MFTLNTNTFTLNTNTYAAATVINLKMFAFLKPLASLFKSAQPMSTSVSSETFASLLSPKLSINTDAFLDVYRQGVAKTKDSDRISALTRFKVKSITVNKVTDTTSEHELLSVVVCDEVTDLEYFFYIERNSASDSTIVSTSIPASAVASAASTSIPSAAIPSAALASATSTSISTTAQSFRQRQRQAASNEGDVGLYELLPTGASPSPSYEPLLPLPPPPHPLSRRASHHSIPEIITLGSARSINSLSSGSLAEDRISGSGRFSGGRGIGQIVRQVLPVDLSLFELGILVDVIHNDAPEYNLLKTQCYWLTLMIFEVLLRTYSNTLDSQNGVAPDQYLPKLSGKWAGLLIVAPREEDLCRVEKKFREQRLAEFSKVNIYFTNFNLCISNSHYLF